MFSLSRCLHSPPLRHVHSKAACSRVLRLSFSTSGSPTPESSNKKPSPSTQEASLLTCGLIATTAYATVYFASLGAIFIALENNVFPLDYFEIDATKSVLELQKSSVGHLTEGDILANPQMKNFALALGLNRFMKVPRVLVSSVSVFGFSSLLGLKSTSKIDGALLFIIFAISFCEQPAENYY